MKKLFPFYLVLLGTIVLVSCGGKEPEVEPDDLDVPTTLPIEQVLYREAKDSFERWIAVFSSDGDFNSGYPLLTWKSRDVLKGKGITDAVAFGSWFAEQRSAERQPFTYDFSRIDVLEIDIKDTTKAVLTVTFVVNVKDQQFESSGIFYLRREHGVWKVPFAERSGFIRGWWEKDQSFDVTVKEAGIAAYVSRDFGVEFTYPVAWDVTEGASFKQPLVPTASSGLLLSYVNPSNNGRETVVRICELPVEMTDPKLVADTSIHTLKPLKSEQATILSEPNLVGRIYWMYNPERQRILSIYAAVDTSFAPFASYASSIDDLIHSLEIVE